MYFKNHCLLAKYGGWLALEKMLLCWVRGLSWSNILLKFSLWDEQQSRETSNPLRMNLNSFVKCNKVHFSCTAQQKMSGLGGGCKQLHMPNVTFQLRHRTSPLKIIQSRGINTKEVLVSWLRGKQICTFLSKPLHKANVDAVFIDFDIL